MAFIPVPNVAQAQVFGRIDGQTTINDLYFATEAPPVTLGQLDALALALDAWFSASILTLLSASYSYEHVRVRDLTSQAGFVVERSDSAGPGGAGGAFVPNNVAPCISFRTAIAGRSGRGRNYIPGVPQSVISGNTISPGFIADTTIAYQGLLATGSFKPAGWTWVVVSRFTLNAPRPAGVANAVLSVLYTDTTVDSQRRRLPGRGI